MQIDRQMRAPNGPALISLHNISVSHNGAAILENISLTVAEGEIVTLIGPNGAGKSTLIKIALKLVKADTGSVAHRDDLTIGYVPQSVNLDPTLPLTVKRFLNLDRNYSEQTIDAILADLGVTRLVDATLQSVSGGELRRILLARAMLRNPDLLILDEPSAGVDVNGQAELYQLIQTIRDRRQCGILLVSHDLHIVMAATDRVFCLNRHLCCSGQPEVVRRHPEFLALFGERVASELAFYHHHHDHEHDLHGDISLPSTESHPHG